MKENRNEDDSQTQSNTDSMEGKKVVLETLLEVEEKVLDKLQKSKFPNSVHENAQRTEIIIAKKMKLDVLKDSIEAITED